MHCEWVCCMYTHEMKGLLCASSLWLCTVLRLTNLIKWRVAMLRHNGTSLLFVNWHCALLPSAIVRWLLERERVPDKDMATMSFVLIIYILTKCCLCYEIHI